MWGWVQLVVTCQLAATGSQGAWEAGLTMTGSDKGFGCAPHCYIVLRRAVLGNCGVCTPARAAHTVSVVGAQVCLPAFSEQWRCPLMGRHCMAACGAERLQQSLPYMCSGE